MASASSAKESEDIDVSAIEDLIDSYYDISETKRRQKKEAAVRQQFVNPLLRALGWDTESEEVRPEHETDVGPADYAIVMDGVDQFYIEAKSFAKDLDGQRTLPNGEKQPLPDQAIDYAYHQRCDWAVLTNFKELRLYWTHVARGSAEDGLVLQIDIDDYLSDDGLEDLSKLSKPSVRRGSLEALERSRDRDPITESVLNTLSDARVQLTRNIHENHPDLDENLLREGVQRILDRLVVMRVAEDRGIIMHDTLRRMMETWDATTINPEERRLIKDLANSFHDFDSVYNSTLFARHPCEEWTVANDVLKDIISDFYQYNFEYVDADILGSIYEDYLGHAIEEKTDGDGITLAERSDERREDGIYYTPPPVVEYIVESTLGERLDSIMEGVRAALSGDEPDFDAAKETFSQIEDIRVLDVSCGSGSFLIKAYDLFVEAYDEYDTLVKDARTDDLGLTEYSNSHKRPDDYRQRILRNNIFGVDLDYQATEIAAVNLFLKALKQGERIPTMLEENIRRGNSLLNGDPEEVADVLDISVDEAKERGAFNWEDEFSDVFDEGGFSVIVGNPPWGADMSSYEDWLEYGDTYSLAENQYDSYEVFVELTGDLLKDGGTLGFIIPDSIIRKDSSPARKWLVENHQIDRVYKLGEGIFDDVYSGTAILQYTNTSPSEDHETEVGLIQKSDREQMMGSGGDALSQILDDKKNITKQERFDTEDGYRIPVWAGEEDYAILDEMEDGTVAWDNVIDNGRGDEIGREGEVMKCPFCMEWDTYPRKRAESKGGGYYDKTCTHCGEEYEFEDAISKREIIQDSPTDGCDTPIYFGEHINRYRTSDQAYIDADVSGVGLKDDWRFDPPKLLIRQASVGFYATVDYSDARCLQAVFSFRPKDDRDSPFEEYDIEYFLGFLNSRAMLYYYAKTEGITEWQSYPRHTQTDIMSLPVPEVDFEENREQYDEFVGKVRDAISGDGKVDEDLDWEIEEMVLDMYDIPDEKRPRIWNELKEMQRLKILRELFPDSSGVDTEE